MNRLMLGSGIHRREGWLTLDADPRNHPDFLATIPPLPDAVKAVKWDEIEWIHGITSLYPWDAAQVLSEIAAILKPDGKLVLEQPDAIVAAKRVIECGDPSWLFGSISNCDPFIMNRWAYVPDSVVALLIVAGFRRIEALPAQHHVPSRDFRIEARL